jgi:hypothetical protein
VETGAINYNVPNGKIFKDEVDSDVTCLLAFTYPVATAGLTCTFHFYLGSGSTLTGANMFDVYSSLQPATQSTSSWPLGNQPNQQIGRMSVTLCSETTYLAGYLHTAASYPCPGDGNAYGYEPVPTDDITDMEWARGGIFGAYIT